MDVIIKMGRTDCLHVIKTNRKSKGGGPKFSYGSHTHFYSATSLFAALRNLVLVDQRKR